MDVYLIEHVLWTELTGRPGTWFTGRPIMSGR
jgi:hypothetical protein